MGAPFYKAYAAVTGAFHIFKLSNKNILKALDNG
jgi:hypothetical protein